MDIVVRERRCSTSAAALVTEEHNFLGSLAVYRIAARLAARLDLPSPGWLAALFTRRMLICVFTGFSSGLPLYLLLNLVPAWLRTEGISLKAIGLFALIQLPYTWKFLWSPLLDRYALPLGRRRGWMLVTQIGLLLSHRRAGPSRAGDRSRDHRLAARPCWPSSRRPQDIALDAFRREILLRRRTGPGQLGACQCLPHRRPGAGFAVADPGRPSALGAGVLDHRAVHAARAWRWRCSRANRPVAAAAPKTLRDAVVEPFREFIGRAGLREALLILAFIFLYKLGDSMCTALATPFYLDMGYRQDRRSAWSPRMPACGRR